ncbi:MAG: heavy metal translocating P-type ATPase [Sulfitobacter sp.]
MTQAITLPIQNMTCGACASRVKALLTKIDGILTADVNLATESVQITALDPEPLKNALGALAEAGYPAQPAELTLSVSGMHCASCVGRLGRAFEAVPGVTETQVNLALENAVLRYIPGVTDQRKLIQVAQAAGFPATLTDQFTPQNHATKKEAEATAHRNAMLIAAALTLPVFVLEMGGHLFPIWHHWIGQTIGHTTSWLIQFILTSVVLIGPGRQFFSVGLTALRRKAPNMDSLVALGAGSAWLFSTVALIAPQMLPEGTRVVYFEAAAVIVTLILLGRWFEARAKGQTGGAIRKLLGLQPRSAVLRRDENWVDVPISDIVVGDTFLLRPGAQVPTDAKVVSGDSYVDESMLTGEPMQIAKSSGDPLTGGSVNGNGSLICRAERVGMDTTLAHIIRMVTDAQGARLPIQALVDRVTLWFVPAVIGVAVLTVVVWLMFGPQPVLAHALVVGVSVLIIACPCAMGLATPTSIMVGTGRAAELGILFRQGDALQSLNSVEVVAFDKTGTLTAGQPELTTFLPTGDFDPDLLMSQIASVEQHSQHPLAAAIADAAAKRNVPNKTATDFKVHSGQGISAVIGGSRIFIGNGALMEEHGADLRDMRAQADALEKEGQTTFFAAQGGVVCALLSVSDPVRPSSAAAIAALKSRGLRVAMITGDAQGTAQAVAQQLGIETVIANVRPEGKLHALQDLRAAYGKVAFVGDGINDAPVLAHADVGIAIGTGTDVAIETADVVLMSGNLRGVTLAFSLSRSTLRNIKQNLAWAFGYNIVLIPVAAGLLYPSFNILLSPGLAAGAMAFSSIFVLGNALRLRRVGGEI